jgi:hypothetical protein
LTLASRLGQASSLPGAVPLLHSDEQTGHGFHFFPPSLHISDPRIGEHF